MFTSLMPELLSINADLPCAAALAVKHGFGGVDTLASHLTAPGLDTDAVADTMAKHSLRPGYISLLPGRIPAADEDWRAALESLPGAAANAQRLGFERAVFVVLPFHESLPFDAAFEDHVRRINAVTAVLDEFGIALGLEYVSPISRRAGYAHPFVYDLRGMLSLCAALASPRVGLLLDSFHWHCAGEMAADIERLTKEQVVAVHVNDAPPVAWEAQVVGERALPGATGIIDIAGFVGALKTIGYEGPVTCEPMASAVAAIAAQGEDAVLERVRMSFDDILPKVG